MFYRWLGLAEIKIFKPENEKEKLLARAREGIAWEYCVFLNTERAIKEQLVGLYRVGAGKF